MIRDRNVQTKFLTDDDENHQQVIANEQAERILRDPGQRKLVFSGTNQKSERRRPFGTGLVRHCPQGLFSPFFTFLRAIFFRPFRLSLAPTICPWVSEDEPSEDGWLARRPA